MTIYGHCVQRINFYMELPPSLWVVFCIATGFHLGCSHNHVSNFPLQFLQKKSLYHHVTNALDNFLVLYSFPKLPLSENNLSKSLRMLAELFLAFTLFVDTC